MVKFLYEIVNGQLCNESEVMIDCGHVQVNGVQKRRMWDEESECYKDYEAFYIMVGAIEYGRIGLTIEQFLAICKGTSVCDGRVQGIYVPAYVPAYV
jgi:hypothetical protein